MQPNDTAMKTTTNNIDRLTKQFDKELRALLNKDLKQFKAGRGKFMSKHQAHNQDKDLLVA